MTIYEAPVTTRLDALETRIGWISKGVLHLNAFRHEHTKCIASLNLDIDRFRAAVEEEDDLLPKDIEFLDEALKATEQLLHATQLYIRSLDQVHELMEALSD